MTPSSTRSLSSRGTVTTRTESSDHDGEEGDRSSDGRARHTTGPADACPGASFCSVDRRVPRQRAHRHPWLHAQVHPPPSSSPDPTARCASDSRRSEPPSAAHESCRSAAGATQSGPQQPAASRSAASWVSRRTRGRAEQRLERPHGGRRRGQHGCDESERSPRRGPSAGATTLTRPDGVPPPAALTRRDRWRRSPARGRSRRGDQRASCRRGRARGRGSSRASRATRRRRRPAGRRRGRAGSRLRSRARAPAR